MMVELQEIFDIEYGNSLDLNKLTQSTSGINFVSRTAKNNGVSAKVNSVLSANTIPKGSITVSLGGSVLEAFVQPSEYYTGYHIFCLTPKIGLFLTINQKLFYCTCIRANKYKYSYGRQANRTLRSLQVPSIDELPKWIDETDLSHFDGAERAQIDKHTSPPIILKTKRLSEIFDIVNGLASSNVKVLSSREDGCVPYMRPASTLQRTVAGYVSTIGINNKYIFPKETLFTSTDGEGSHTYSYVSLERFIPNSNVVALVPKVDMSLKLKLYYAKCITQNRYLFSYGRKPKGKRLARLLLPSPAAIEVKIIEEFMGSLNYSINL